MNRIFAKLDEYKEERKKSLKESEFLSKSEEFVLEKEASRSELNKWMAILNQIKFNENEWKRIRSES